MPHLSNKKVSKEITETLQIRLFEVIGLVGKRGMTKNLAKELFSETELRMFAKRLGVFQMLTEGASSYAIAQKLGMSHSTVIRLEESFQGKRSVLGTVLKELADTEKFWDTVGKVSRGGLPPKGVRWKKKDFS